MLKKVWFLFIAVSTPLLAHGDPLPPWFPAKFAPQVEKLSTEKSDDPVAILYFCAPYCETVGEFLNRTNFKIVAKDLIPEVEKAGNLPRLRFLINPMGIIAADPADNHDAEKMAGQQKLDRHGNPEDMPKEDDEGNGDQPLLLGAHIDAMMGATSLTTGSAGDVTHYTDLASDAKAHGIFGGGLDFGMQDVTTFWHGFFDMAVDVSYWGSIGQSSSLATAGQVRSTQVLRAEIEGLWHRDESRWKFGLIIDGRQENDNSSPDTADSFSTKYLWISPGFHIQYAKTTLKLIKSVYSSTLDIDQYRGTSVSSSNLVLNLESCRKLAKIVKGEFDICGLADYQILKVNGAGTPAQPVFVTSPTYSYSSWSLGVEFKLLGITF